MQTIEIGDESLQQYRRLRNEIGLPIIQGDFLPVVHVSRDPLVGYDMVQLASDGL